MMAWMILMLSVAALLQFFVSYCRSLIGASSTHVLSVEVQEVTGLNEGVRGEDFARVVQYLHLCPTPAEDRSSVQAIGAYYKLLNFVSATVAIVVPQVRAWAERERAECARFITVALDRRIAFSRGMLAQEMDA
jgi:hypothetical protein